MRKALIASSSFILLSVLLCGNTYGKVENPGSSLKYNYVVETDMSVADFSNVFFERLKTKHNWSEVSKNVCKYETCTSIWSFTDDEMHKWRCEVTIKKADISNSMIVTMEMNPVMGS